jgi:hypothetical protein
MHKSSASFIANLGAAARKHEWNESSKGKKLQEKKANRTEAHVKNMGETLDS